MAGSVSHIVLVIMSKEGGTVLERWVFDTKLVDRELVPLYILPDADS